MFLAEFAISGKDKKGKQADEYKRTLIDSGLFEYIDTGIACVISGGELRARNNFDFRIFVKCIPDYVLGNVMSYLKESHAQSMLAANLKLFDKNTISSGADIYQLLVLDTAQRQKVGDAAFGDAQGHALEGALRAMLTKKEYLPDGGEYVDLRQPPYSVDADFGISFDSENCLLEYYRNLRDAESCFKLQTKRRL
ncbi:hypothetical protein L6303_05520 [archaeon]|nr:hypothetical protein [Nanoarchaeota archaeon]MBU4300536.1 hypothetical protein [Nanoarchaeota archaeon]MCG2724177.1 hypothetical protein [archaeon]